MGTFTMDVNRLWKERENEMEVEEDD